LVLENAQIQDGRLNGTFTAASATLPRIPLTQVKGKIRVGEDRIVHLENMTAKAWSGNVQGDATVDLNDPTTPAFRIQSSVKEAQANEFLSSITPAKNILTGTLEMSSVISGKGSVAEAIARSLTGEGSLSAKGGQLQLSPAIAAIWSSL
jgi:hypothetical protein